MATQRTVGPRRAGRLAPRAFPRIRGLVLGALLGSLGAGCDSGARAREQLAQRQRERATAAPVADAGVRLPAPYDDSQALRLVPDGPCPRGLAALFAAKGEALGPQAEAVEALPYLVQLGPRYVHLGDYDAPNGRFVIEVEGSVDCTDDAGHVTIAWTKAAAQPMTPSAVEQADGPRPYVWVAPQLKLQWPFASPTGARDFALLHRSDVTARVALRLGPGEVDVRPRKVPKVETQAAGQTLSYGGGLEDWGAGRLVRARLVGVRVAVDAERKELVRLVP
jgi:hypothetical protein